MENYLIISRKLFDYPVRFVDGLRRRVEMIVLEKRTRQIMGSILAGVLHLHSHRVVHRDLKPEKSVKIISFIHHQSNLYLVF